MKKTLLLIAVALFVSSTAFSQFKFGAGLTMGTKAGMDAEGTKVNFGLNLKGLYSLSDEFAMTLGATYFLPNTYGDPEMKFKNNFQFNLDGQYYFMTEDTKFYVLGGLNWLTNKKGDDDAMDKFGFEAGAGVEFGNIFVEGKYDFNTMSEQLFFTVGYYF